MYTDSKGNRCRPASGRTADRIFGELVDRILDGSLAPGDGLSEQALAGDFRVSRTPVREALQHLELAGLAERGPRRAFMVRRMEAVALRELFETLGELEAVCAELSALRMRAAERHALREIVAAGAACAAAGDADGYVGINVRFHQALFDGAHNPTLGELAHGVRVRSAPYREAQFRKTARLATSQAEHERILAAVLAEDPAAARSAMREHIAATAANVVAMVASSLPAGV